MWVPAVLVGIAALLSVGRIRGLFPSESVAAFVLTGAAVVLLFQLDRLS